MQPQLIEEEVKVGEDKPNNLQSEPVEYSVLKELLCSEDVQLPEDDEDEDSTDEEDPIIEKRESSSVKSYFDPSLLNHPNTIQQLKILEKSNRKSRDYFRSNSDGILPYMRKVVAMWMLEVSEEQSCEDSVFPLAVGILDQFLGCTQIKVEQLQLVGCCCLLLASKTRQETHFSLDLLSFYTENSVSLQTLMSWELMILSQLNWDINVITPIDYIDFYLGSLGLDPQRFQLIRRHTVTFISLCYTEPRFATVSPSQLASAAILTAIRGIQNQSKSGGGGGGEEDESKRIASILSNVSSTNYNELINLCEIINGIISQEISRIQQTMDTKIQKSNFNSSSSSNNNNKYNCYNNSSSLTPNDIQDILC